MHEELRLYCDIDGTICTQEKDYRDAEPLREAIEKINQYFDMGYIITYWTARGGTSGKDWRYYTEKQLKEWGCRYHFLDCGNKPDFDIIVDDRARRIEDL